MGDYNPLILTIDPNLIGTSKQGPTIFPTGTLNEGLIEGLRTPPETRV